jgi:hypothetical protein
MVFELQRGDSGHQFSSMRRRSLRRHLNSSSPISVTEEGVRVLPSLATAEQIAEAVQVTPRTVHYWAEAGTIPTALRQGKIVRFHPPAVAAALGIQLPEFGV